MKQITIICLLAISIFNALAQNKPNVLFICVDDLRPDLGCYGAKYIHSPSIDKLASEGVIFNKHFSTVPTCSASRASLLTGMLPKAKEHLSNEACQSIISGKKEQKRPESFIHHLKRNGYYTAGIGKISHSADGMLYSYNEPVGAERELPHSWDKLVFDAGKWQTGWNAFFGYADGSNRQSKLGLAKPYEKTLVEDEGYVDGLTANLAIKTLGDLAKTNQPFFLGIGFFKPHLPFNAPSKYWDLYQEKNIELTPSPNIPLNINKASLHNSGEFNSYKDGDELASLQIPLSNAYARKLRHAYYASVSYIDAQIGKVLDQLEQLGLSQNTIVVLWSDHGWHLGDHMVWGKHTIFDQSLRSVLIIKNPTEIYKNRQVDKVVSSIDIYPTIVELCGIKMPFKTDGKSLVGLLENKKLKAWNQPAYSYYNNGISLRTDRYRFTKYFRKQEPTIELYDLFVDPFENKNIAFEQPNMVKKLLLLLEKGNTGLYQSNQ